MAIWGIRGDECRWLAKHRRIECHMPCFMFLKVSFWSRRLFSYCPCRRLSQFPLKGHCCPIAHWTKIQLQSQRPAGFLLMACFPQASAKYCGLLVTIVFATLLAEKKRVVLALTGLLSLTPINLQNLINMYSQQESWLHWNPTVFMLD